MKHFCSFFGFLLVALVSQAQWAVLDNSDLATVEYRAIVYTGSATVLANESGLFRSTDNGLTWARSVSGLDTANTEVENMTFIGGSRNEVWIRTFNGLYFSDDHALTWKKAPLNGMPAGAWVDRIGSFGTRVFTILSYWDNILMKTITKLAYTDNGSDWSVGALLSEDNSSWWEMGVEENSRALFLIEYPNSGSAKLWYTTNGNTIQQIPQTGLPAGSEMNRRAISVDPGGNNLLFNNEKSPGYYRFNFSTQEWESRMNGIVLTGFNVAQTFRAHSFSGLSLATVLFADASMNLQMNLFSSTDGGDNWTIVADPGLQYPIFEERMVRAGDDVIIGEYFNSNLARSATNGQTWTISRGIQTGDFRQLRALGDGTLVVISQEQLKGIIKSTDNGETWTSANGNLPNFMGIYILEDIHASGNMLWALAAENPFDEKLFLYLCSDLSSGTWNKITTIPDSANIRFAGMNGPWPVYFLYNNQDQGTYQMTKDNGTTWKNLSSGIAPLGLEKVYGFRGNAAGGKLFLFGRKSEKTRIYLSENEGTSFFDITSNLDGINFDILISNQYDWDDIASIIASFRADGRFFLAARDYTEPPGSIRFFMLDETEDLWVKQGTKGLDVYYNVNWNNLRFNSGVWYLASSVALFASIDNCATWIPVWNNEGFPMGARPGSFVMNNYGAYLGTRGAGIWRAQLSAPTITTLPATSITDTTAASGATIVSTGGLPFGGKGLCWALTENPTTADNVVYSGKSWDSFTDTMRLLLPNTTYYARAFVQSPKGAGQPVYGNQITFTTDNLTRIVSETGERIALYPNPSDGRFRIETGSDWQMTVMDVTGKIIKSERIEPGVNSITLGSPPAGMYFVRLTGPDGRVRVERLIVK